MWDSSVHSQSIPGIQDVVSIALQVAVRTGFPTRFAGLVFNFSNIFCDCDFEAMAAIFADLRQAVECALEYGDLEEMVGRWAKL
jgi:hypothetical protein